MPTLLSRTYTHYAAAGLFAYFGFKLLKEAREMTGSGDHEELRETEAELGISSESSNSGATEGAKAGSDGFSDSSSKPTVEDMPGQSISSSGGKSPLNSSNSNHDLESGGDSNGKGFDKTRGPRKSVGALPMLLHYCKKDWAILTQVRLTSGAVAVVFINPGPFAIEGV